MLVSKWLEKLSDRRRAPRRKVEGLSAVYWNGAPAKPRPIREVSLTGAVIETPEDWYRGTLIHVVLENSLCLDKSGKATAFGLWAKVVRRGPEGVCVEFVLRGPSETAGLEKFFRSFDRREDYATQGLGKAIMRWALACGVRIGAALTFPADR